MAGRALALGLLAMVVPVAARADGAGYLDVTFLMQNSESMMMADTPAGIASLQPLTANASCWQTTNFNARTMQGTPSCPGSSTCTQGSQTIDVGSQSDLAGLQGCQCADACHWSAKGGDYYSLARTSGIALRLDDAQAAVVAGIQMLAKTQSFAGQYGVQVMAFSQAAARIWPTEGEYGAQAAADAGNLAGAASAVQKLKPLVTPDVGDTNFPQAMGDLVNGTGRFAGAGFAGNGDRPAHARKAVIIVTNGIQDWGRRTMVPGYSLAAGMAANPNGAEGPISANDCAAIKQHGYRVYVLYTTYLTSPLTLMLDNDALVPYISGVVETGADAAYDLAANLAACASTADDMIAAEGPDDIQSAMLQLVEKAMNGQ